MPWSFVGARFLEHCHACRLVRSFATEVSLHSFFCHAAQASALFHVGDIANIAPSCRDLSSLPVCAFNALKVSSFSASAFERLAHLLAACWREEVLTKQECAMLAT